MPAVGIRSMVRSIAYAAIAAAMVAAALHFRQPDLKPRDAAGIAASSSSDRLAAELTRCQALGMAAKDDPVCTAAWGENRRRFFGSAPSPDMPATSAKPGQTQ
jgi:conjugative transfer region protein TrbK